MAPHGKELSEDLRIIIVALHKDGRGYKKFGNTLKLMKLKVKVMEWPSMSPDLNSIEHMWGILKRKVKHHHVSNIQQLRDVIMEEWKRTPATTCAALVNSMPRRIKAVLDNNGAPTKY